MVHVIRWLLSRGHIDGDSWIECNSVWIQHHDAIPHQPAGEPFGSTLIGAIRERKDPQNLVGQEPEDGVMRGYEDHC
jgi:hypothetical protein